LLWQAEFPTLLRTPAVGLDGTLYVDAYNTLLHAVEPLNSKTRWTYSGVIGSPSIHGDGSLICRTGDGLLALDVEGNVKWEFLHVRFAEWRHSPSG
jgi:outer membrane protein assembly factor BamB